jgi:alpha,alpha-trehalose phosphorylase
MGVHAMRFNPRARDAFGRDPWLLKDEAIGLEDIRHRETILSQGNGAFGMRGTLEEPVDENPCTRWNACFLNGFYEHGDILYTWRRHGIAERTQVMLRIPDWHRIETTFDGIVFSVASGSILSSTRTLDMRNGLLTRTVEWRSPSGTLVRIDAERFVSMARQRTVAVRYRVTLLEKAPSAAWSVALATSLDGDV